MGLTVKVEVGGYRLVRFQHEDLVVKGTRCRRLSGYRSVRWLGSHEALLWERIGRTLLCIHLPLRGWWLLLRGLRRQGRRRC